MTPAPIPAVWERARPLIGSGANGRTMSVGEFLDGESLNGTQAGIVFLLWIALVLGAGVLLVVNLP